MRFTIAALLSLASFVLAGDPTAGFEVMTKPGKGEDIPAGSTYGIAWQHDTTHPGPVTITLIGGASQSNLNDVQTIAKGIDGSLGAYSWSVDKSLGSEAVYGLRISLDSNPSIFQWSFSFTISGGASGNSSSSSSSASGGSTSTQSGGSSTTSAPALTTSTTQYSNRTTTTGGQSLTVVTSVVTPTSSPTKTSSTTSVPTNAAAPVAVGSFALLGGLAMAMFAL